MPTLFKMALHQLPLRAWDEPISAIYGGRPVNDKVKNMICLKTGISAKTLRK